MYRHTFFMRRAQWVMHYMYKLYRSHKTQVAVDNRRIFYRTITRKLRVWLPSVVKFGQQKHCGYRKQNTVMLTDTEIMYLRNSHLILIEIVYTDTNCPFVNCVFKLQESCWLHPIPPSWLTGLESHTDNWSKVIELIWLFNQVAASLLISSEWNY